jgi:hypothetical protein
VQILSTIPLGILIRVFDERKERLAECISSNGEYFQRSENTIVKAESSNKFIQPTKLSPPPVLHSLFYPLTPSVVSIDKAGGEILLAAALDSNNHHFTSDPPLDSVAADRPWRTATLPKQIVLSQVWTSKPLTASRPISCQGECNRCDECDQLPSRIGRILVPVGHLACVMPSTHDETMVQSPVCASKRCAHWTLILAGVPLSVAVMR